MFTPEDDLEALKEHLEKVNAQWAGLAKAPPAQVPAESAEIDPWRLSRELKGHLEERRRWDVLFGQLIMLFQSIRGWHLLGFANFGHYCEEVLGMGERTAAQRAALERGLVRNPVLRQALAEKRLSYEKARLIARDATPEEVATWIEKAQGLTCVELRRQLQDSGEAQMCARGQFNVWLTTTAAGLLKGAFRALRAAAKRWRWAEECLVTGRAPDGLVWEFELRQSYAATAVA